MESPHWKKGDHTGYIWMVNHGSDSSGPPIQVPASLWSMNWRKSDDPQCEILLVGLRITIEPGKRTLRVRCIVLILRWCLEVLRHPYCSETAVYRIYNQKKRGIWTRNMSVRKWLNLLVPICSGDPGFRCSFYVRWKFHEINHPASLAGNPTWNGNPHILISIINPYL